MAGPGSRWSLLDADGRSLGVVAARVPGLPQLVVYPPSSGLAPPGVGRSLGAGADAALTVARTLPPAFAGQVLAVAGAPDQTVSLTLNSGLTVLLGTTDDLTAKYEDVAAIIAHAPLTGAKTIDVTVPQSPTVA
ncbi:MAG: cell division protein FtsQ/DivIB [Acidimicrobiales bacterium]|nr:cell division protein FtsQ/DivIB [Acidimicrobiales bacterium]